MAIKSRVLKEKKKRNRSLYLLYFVTAIFIVGLLIGLRFYNRIFAPIIQIEDESTRDIFIPSDPSFEELVSLLEYSGLVTDMNSFIWLARRKGSLNRFKGGRYVLKNGMSNNELVNMLRAGRQSPVNVTFTNIRTPEELAQQLARRLEPDSLQFIEAFANEDLVEAVGYELHTLFAMILPNTYEMFWTTKAEDFVKRIADENKRFWNRERLKKAEDLELSPIEVATLGSIVDEETVMSDEKSRVAGVYINRLKLGMRLQADPTIKFVLGDFSVNRVLNSDLLIDSPYNTYKYAGLPPGPIRMPSIAGIDAVLNYEKHPYLYMCARDDFSGYHAFAQTLRQHQLNAAKYRRALNQRRIYR